MSCASGIIARWKGFLVISAFLQENFAITKKPYMNTSMQITIVVYGITLFDFTRWCSIRIQYIKIFRHRKSVLLIAVWVILLESPCIFAHIMQITLCVPAKNLICFLRICIECWKVTCSSFADFVINLLTSCVLKCIDNIKNAVSDTCADIISIYAVWVGFKLIQCTKMSFCKVYYMNIVTNASAVLSVVIPSEYSKLWQLADCNS